VADTILAQIVDISPRTLTRRRHEGRLQPAESDRLWRIGHLFERASKLLGGPAKAREWFKRPKKALGGKTPIEYTDTEPGINEVENLLGRIEHGVFS
jgi:putative toxin-antitoxin system antitoxin component (TIGR02293 family)